MSETVRKQDHKPAEGFTHTVPKIVSMMEQESTQLADNVVSVTAEGYQIVKAGPYRFIGKAMYARGFGESHEIFSKFWETEKCKWVFKELDKLSEYASDEKHDAALLTWELYNNGERKGNGETKHGPNCFIGYTVGRFMQANTPVPENLDYIDIPEIYLARMYYDIPEADYKRGWYYEVDEWEKPGNNYPENCNYQAEYKLRGALERQGLYKSMHHTLMGMVYPDSNKNQSNGMNYGYFIACRPLNEDELSHIQIKEELDMPVTERAVYNIDLTTMQMRGDVELRYENDTMVIKTHGHIDWMETIQQFDCPVKINMRAKTDKDNIRIYYGNHPENSCIILGDTFYIGDIVTGKEYYYPGYGSAPANKYVDIEWIINRDVMIVKVNGELRHTGTHYPYIYKLSEPGYEIRSSVRIGCTYGSTVTIESLRVAEL